MTRDEAITKSALDAGGVSMWIAKNASWIVPVLIGLLMSSAGYIASTAVQSDQIDRNTASIKTLEQSKVDKTVYNIEMSHVREWMLEVRGDLKEIRNNTTELTRRRRRRRVSE